MADIQHLATLTEEDIKFRYITPAIEQAGWQKNQMRLEHCQPIRDWWNDRKEIITTDEEGNVLDEKSRRFTAQQLIDLSCNFDQCKFPKSEEEVLPPAELLADYHKRREALDAQIDKMLSNIGRIMEGEHVDNHGGCAKVFEELALLQQSFPARLRQSILQEAISGKLVPQDENDEPASMLLDGVQKQREQLIKDKKVKAKDIASEPIGDDEKPFELPAKWEFVRLNYVAIIARGGSPRPIKEYLTDSPDGLNWIKIGDTEKGGKYINQTRERIKPEGLKKSRMIHKGDFLLTNSMSFGRPYISNIDGCIHDGWLVISPAFGEVFDKNYLYYVLSSPYARDQFLGKVSGAVVQNLNSDKVATSIIPLPPLAEQQRIVAKIEELFEQIDKISK